MAHQAQPAKRGIEPATSAWFILLAFFLIFCVIVAAAGVAGWRYYNEASIAHNGQLRVHVNAGVTYQARGSAQAVSLERLDDNICPDSDDICKPIAEGTRVKTRPEAGYGPVASIKLFDATQVDLWAHPIGADLTLQTYQVSRWTRQRQVVVFQQNAGYARYDIAGDQPYVEVDYAVEISGGVRITMERGGSYSINMPASSAEGSPAEADAAPTLVEVAVRSGSATVLSGRRQEIVRPREKLAVDTSGRLAVPTEAVWELIDDGSFDRYPKEKYDELSDAWVIRSAPAAQSMPKEEQNGTFTAVKECPPEKVDLCEASDEIYVGQFRRDGNQRSSYITAIDQPLDADVSEYTRSLHFSAQLRVLTQTVALAGVAGSECPIMITLTYKETSPTDQEEERTTCVYAGDSEATVKVPYISYIRVPFYKWHQIDIELRGDRSPLKHVRYLQQIRIYANGHDYVSEITRVSLKGTP